MKIKSYKNGVFCYSELSAKSYNNAVKFYSELFDWNTKENRDILKYTTFYKENFVLLGAYDAEDEQLNIDFSNTWLPFIAVADIEKVIEKSQKYGGKCLQESFEAENYGKAAIIEDPAGALFCLWEAKKAIGSKLQRELNTMSLNELHSTDIKKSEEFYKKVFLWKSELCKTETEEYINLKKGNIYIGGIQKINKKSILKKSRWVMYIEVDDCQKIIKKALKLGGELTGDIVKYNCDSEELETALLKDSDGVIFGIVKKSYKQKEKKSNLIDYRDICLSLPDSEETFPFGIETCVIKVKGKVFALLYNDNISLKCDPWLALDYRDSYKGVTAGYHLNKKHWNTIDINSDVSKTDIIEMIIHSYKCVVNKIKKSDREILLSKLEDQLELLK